MAINAASTSARANGQGTDWRQQASCAEGSGTKLFFPVGVTGAAEVQIHQAKAVCATCPVKSECLDFAITTNQEYGVWGGNQRGGATSSPSCLAGATPGVADRKGFLARRAP